MLIVKVKNITGTHSKANYHYEVWVNDRLIAEGKVKDFMRRWGYAELLRTVARAVQANGDPKMENEEG